MGNQNPNTPAARGMEERYSQGFVAGQQHPLYITQERLRPGAITPTHVHLCLPTVKGAPGLHVAVVDRQQPVPTTTDFFPGSDTSAVTTGFEDQGAAAVNFGDVNDPQDASDFATNAAAMQATTNLAMQFRGNNAGTLAGKRILTVEIVAWVMNRRTVGTGLSGNTINLPITAEVVINGFTYKGQQVTIPKSDAFQVVNLVRWDISPVTGLPWDFNEVDDILDATDADTFGYRVWGRADDAGLRVSAYALRVTYCTENRKGFLDLRGTPRQGWDRYALASTSALSANTEYWIEVCPLACSVNDYFTLGVVSPTLPPATVATDNTKDHRKTSVVIAASPGGAGQPGVDKIAESNNQIAFLLESAGPTINAESQPYVEVDYEFVGTFLGVNLGAGMEITTAASQPAGGYAGVTLPVGWWNKAQRPNKPLYVEIRHGAGAYTGGGTLDATATLYPEWTRSGDVQDVFIPFDGGLWVPSNSTQYQIIIRSEAIAEFGFNAWRIPKLDTRTDLILSGSGTSSANVIGASYDGGGGDNYFTYPAGVEDTRYDIPIALTAPPSTVSSVSVTSYEADPPGMGIQSTLPPRVRASWPATALGSSFRCYHVWTRRRALPVEQPALVAELKANTFSGMTNAQAEANLTEFWLYELGYSVLGGYYDDGWDIGISVVHDGNRLESQIRWISLGQTIDATSPSWLVSNKEPWLNTPVGALTRDASSEPLSEPTVYKPARDHAIARVPGFIPGRKYKVGFASDADYSDESILRGPRAAYVFGAQMSLLRCRGERAIGTVSEPTTDVEDVQLAGTIELTTTAGDSALAGPNMPAGFVMNGSSQRIDHADNALLRPGAGPFTVLIMAVFPSTLNACHLWKDDGTQGYTFINLTASKFTARLRGSSGTAALTDPTWPYDGLPHVAVLTTPGTGTGTKRLYRDSDLVVTSTTNHGSVSNTHALNIAGDQGALFSALAPVHAYAVWQSELSGDQVDAATRYLQGHSNGRMPAGASLFVDARDKRSHGKTGFVNDLSGNTLVGTLVGTPLLRGRPWPLEKLDAKR